MVILRSMSFQDQIVSVWISIPKRANVFLLSVFFFAFNSRFNAVNVATLDMPFQYFIFLHCRMGEASIKLKFSEQ